MRMQIVILFSLSAACATTASSVARNFERAQYDVPSALNNFETKKLTDREFVSVSGYLTFGDDKHNLWSNSKEYQYIRDNVPPSNDPAWGQCISLSDYGKLRSNLLKNDGKNVVIYGYIHRHTPEADEVNLGSCSDVFISMDGVGSRVIRARE